MSLEDEIYQTLNSDQAKITGAIENFARVIATFYRVLEEEGVPDPTLSIIVQIYVATLLNVAIHESQ